MKLHHAPSGQDIDVPDAEVADIALRLVGELQAAVDKAHSALSSSAYVGGLSERDAFRAALDALGPVVTQRIGQNAPSRQQQQRLSSAPRASKAPTSSTGDTDATTPRKEPPE